MSGSKDNVASHLTDIYRTVGIFSVFCCQFLSLCETICLHFIFKKAGFISQHDCFMHILQSSKPN